VATKVCVLALAAIAGIGLLAVNRSQAAIGDVAFMQSMIPHHSIAINNARKAHITDLRVRKLADGIIKGQVKEIAEMKILIHEIEANGSRGQQQLQPVTADVTPDMLPEIEKAVK
jgi:hypothetical protein